MKKILLSFLLASSISLSFSSFSLKGMEVGNNPQVFDTTQIPNEVWQKILSYLNIKELIKVSHVCMNLRINAGAVLQYNKPNYPLLNSPITNFLTRKELKKLQQQRDFLLAELRRLCNQLQAQQAQPKASKNEIYNKYLFLMTLIDCWQSRFSCPIINLPAFYLAVKLGEEINSALPPIVKERNLGHSFIFNFSIKILKMAFGPMLRKFPYWLTWITNGVLPYKIQNALSLIITTKNCIQGSFAATTYIAHTPGFKNKIKALCTSLALLGLYITPDILMLYFLSPE